MVNFELMQSGYDPAYLGGVFYAINGKNLRFQLCNNVAIIFIKNYLELIKKIVSLIYKQRNDMNSATISISKIATKIVGGKVTNHKLGQFAEIISGYEVISINGISKEAKLAKYQEILVNAGYELSETVWYTNAGFEGQNSDVFNFSFIYILCQKK